MQREKPTGFQTVKAYNKNMSNESDLDTLSEEIVAMAQAQTMPTSVKMNDMEALNLALEDFNFSETGVVQEIIENEELFAEEANVIEVSPNSKLNDDELRDLDAHIERVEAYEAQEATPGGDPAAQPPAATKSKAVKKATTAPSGAPRATRLSRDLASIDPKYFFLHDAQNGTDPEEVKASTLALKPSQVKVADKFEALFASLSVGKLPNHYIMIPFRLLKQQKSATSADIIGAYKTANLGDGTARSQCGQIMNLFSTVGIATRSGNSLTLREDSVIAKRISDLDT